MSQTFRTFKSTLEHCEQEGISIAEAFLRREMALSGKSREDIFAIMEERVVIMQESVKAGYSSDLKSLSGMVGGDAKILMDALNGGKAPGLLDPVAHKAMAYAMAVNEENARMHRIVACPTGGGSGSVPGPLLAVAEARETPLPEIVMACFTAGGVGVIINEMATLAGSEGGCQAEVGVGCAMASAAMVEMLGGTPAQAADAVSIALKSALGMVCDPLAGLVEVPCVKRNGVFAVHALTAAQMVLCGVKSIVPTDEVVKAMKSIGDAMHPSLKETAEGGLAQTETGKLYAIRLQERKRAMKGDSSAAE